MKLFFQFKVINIYLLSICDVNSYEAGAWGIGFKLRVHPIEDTNILYVYGNYILLAVV